MSPSPPRSGGDELLRAGDVLARRRSRPGGSSRLPEGVVLCHQPSLLGKALAPWRARRLRGFSADVRRLFGRKVAVATRFGVGSPAAVALLEELIAHGATRFVSIGLAGGLSPDAKPGDVILAAHAISAEGTSAHYGAGERGVASEPLAASERLTARLAEALRSAGVLHATGTVSTTDAPYRTTMEHVHHWTREGAVAVEMEAAGLFAAGRWRGVDVAAACCVADHLSHDGWAVDFDRSAVALASRGLLAAAVEALEA